MLEGEMKRIVIVLKLCLFKINGCSLSFESESKEGSARLTQFFIDRYNMPTYLGFIFRNRTRNPSRKEWMQDFLHVKTSRQLIRKSLDSLKADFMLRMNGHLYAND